MKAKIHQIKLVICEETAAIARRYVYVKRTSECLSSFCDSFTDEDSAREVLQSLLFTADRVEDECEELYHRLRNDIDEANLTIFDAQYKKAKDKFLNLIKEQKGLYLSYVWSEGEDYYLDQGIISLAKTEPTAFNFTSDNAFTRELAKASYES